MTQQQVTKYFYPWIIHGPVPHKMIKSFLKVQMSKSSQFSQTSWRESRVSKLKKNIYCCVCKVIHLVNWIKHSSANSLLYFPPNIKPYQRFRDTHKVLDADVASPEDEGGDRVCVAGACRQVERSLPLLKQKSVNVSQINFVLFDKDGMMTRWLSVLMLDDIWTQIGLKYGIWGILLED